MWLRDPNDGNMFNLSIAISIEIELLDFQSDKNAVIVKYSSTSQTLTQGTFEHCAAIVDRIYEAMKDNGHILLKED